MAAPSPVQLANKLPDHTISSDGKQIDSTIQVISIDVWTGVNRLPRARLVLSDGSAANEDFPISESDALIPGKALTIALGYGSSQTEIFSGVIQKHGLDINANGPSRLIIEATDKALAMTLARKNAVFQNITDSSLCEKLIGDAGLSADVSSTSTEHESIVQYYATDWDMLILRAQANGMVVMVEDGKVTISAPETSGSPVLSLAFGDSILDFRADLDAATQLDPSAVKSFAWDPATQDLAQSTSASTNVKTPGNLSSDTLAKAFETKNYVQQSAGEMDTGELSDWSSAELLKSHLSKIRGEVRFQGSALVTTGKMVTLAGLGGRFNGDGWVSGVHQQLAEGLWRTTVELGLAPGWFAASAPQIAAPGASGQLPPANNVMAGKVKQIDSDPDGEYRVLVTLPLLQAQDGVWARFGSFYASNGIGSNFYPEIGDEVVIAFLGGDPRYPVVMGSLYSKANPPPYPPTSGDDPAPNDTKSFTTKSKMRINFVESDPSILVTTPGDQSLKIDDKGKAITITDMNGNSMTFDEGGISIKSEKDIKISAGGSVNISADSNVDISASASLSASASASAKLTADGTVQVKGAMVELNP